MPSRSHKRNSKLNPAERKNPSEREGPTEKRNSSGQENSLRAKKNAELLVCLAEFRLAHQPPLTWDELAAVCGVSRPMLFNAVKRGTVSDRKAAVIRGNVGHLLKVQANVA